MTGAQSFALRGRLALGGELVDGAVVVEDGRIVAITRAARDHDLPATVIDAPIVSPGFVDLQVNGAYGVEVHDSADALARIALSLPATGVTAFLPTIISSLPDAYERAFTVHDAARDSGGARILGLHLEGPFLSPERKGAHPIAAIEGATDDLFARLAEWPSLRLMTLAPERPGGIDRIRRLVDRGVLVSLGHSESTWAQFEAGVDAGARMATHLYNAMSSFTHREPHAAGAALTDDRVTVGLIPDGVHSHPASVRLAVRAKGVDRVTLVTDQMAAAGMPPGTYLLGGQPVETDGRSAVLRPGVLAGSVVLMHDAVRLAAEFAGVSVASAIRMATEVPAALLGEPTVGRLVVGAAADVVALGDDLSVRGTWVNGRQVFTADDEMPSQSAPTSGG